jgi:putative ATP-dependent DNA helicase
MNLGIEDEVTEFKKSTAELSEAMKSVSAMLNKHGHGMLYFGVAPNGEVVGQMVSDSTLRDISRKIYESIEPRIIPTVNQKFFADKSVIEVIFFGKNKPYSADGKYYIRSADEDRILPTSELRQLFEYDQNNSWDRELSQFTIEDISAPTFEKFYNRAVACGRLKESVLNPKAILTKLGLLIDGRLTNAANLLFSKNNPIVLKMAVFATDEKLTFLDINRVRGNIYDLIDRADTYISQNIRWQAKIEGLKREEIPEIPVKAYREIICNSFAHARYFTSTEHEIDIHPGRVSIYNPGEFPIGYKPEDFVNENIKSHVRNPLILDTLYLSDDVESYSSGFKRVYAACAEAKVKTEYSMQADGFSFTFMRQNASSIEYSKNENAVLSLLSESPEATVEIIATSIGISVRTVFRAINSLKQKGKIERVGGNKDGYWKINN